MINIKPADNPSEPSDIVLALHITEGIARLYYVVVEVPDKATYTVPPGDIRERAALSDCRPTVANESTHAVDSSYIACCIATRDSPGPTCTG
jgi:hypothetical protein